MNSEDLENKYHSLLNRIELIKQKVYLRHTIELLNQLKEFCSKKKETNSFTMEIYEQQTKNLDKIESMNDDVMEEMNDAIKKIEENRKKTLNYPDGGIYEGEFKDGVPHGTGTLKFPDGGSYIGQFKDGIINGQGTLMFKDGGNYYGQHKDGRPHGHGTLTFPNGEKRVGKFENGKLVGKNN
ncbi:MORN repeat-containing protein [Candidatus Pelagibacter sp. HIMB1587]|uniref:MORN repeat-containing protein n=1 Tax=Candidatus Pelagibacter sp. HIMB1587 TaxID=3413354 RepID=UPI003F846622